MKIIERDYCWRQNYVDARPDHHAEAHVVVDERSEDSHDGTRVTVYATKCGFEMRSKDVKPHVAGVKGDFDAVVRNGLDVCGECSDR